MNILSVIDQIDLEMRAPLLVALIFGLILAAFVLPTLIRALKMRAGHTKTEIIGARLESVQEVVDAPPSHLYKNAALVLDNQDQPTLIKKLKLGSDLRKANLLRLGGRFILLLKGQISSWDQIQLLGLANGQDIFISKKDVAHFLGLNPAHSLLVAMTGGLLGFLFLMAPLTAKGYEIGAVAACLACGLIPAAVLFAIYRSAAERFTLQNQEKMKQFALNWQPDDSEARGTSGRGRAMPLLVASSEAAATSSTLGYLIFGIFFVVIKLLFKWLIVMSSIFARPRLELRRLTINSPGEAKRDADGSLYLKNAVLQDPSSGVKKKIKRLSPAENLLRQGLFDEGVTGWWLIQAGKLGHPGAEETIGSFKMAAYLEDEKEPRSHFDLAEIFKLYNYQAVMGPVLAGLSGALIGYVAVNNLTAWSPSSVHYLWLIPAAALPVCLMIMARKRITSAVSGSLQANSVIAGTHKIELE